MSKIPQAGGPANLRQIAENAFRYHEEKRITREELVSILEQCVNVAAIENGYADAYGLPFPEHAEVPA